MGTGTVVITRLDSTALGLVWAATVTKSISVLLEDKGGKTSSEGRN